MTDFLQFADKHPDGVGFALIVICATICWIFSSLASAMKGK